MKDRHTPNLLDRKILILIRGVTYTNQRIDHVTSREREARAAEPLSDSGVQPRRHLRRHVVGPVPGLPFPEVCRVRERRDGSSARPVHLEAPHRLEPAQPHDVRRPRRSPRLPDERRDLPDVAGRVAQHLLVPHEQHGVRAGLARVPVAQDVVPDGAAQAAAIAGGLEQLGEWEVGLDPSGEVLHGNPSGPCMPFVNLGTISAVQFEKMSGNLL
jgi:hypothetical protein